MIERTNFVRQISNTRSELRKTTRLAWCLFVPVDHERLQGLVSLQFFQIGRQASMVSSSLPHAAMNLQDSNILSRYDSTTQSGTWYERRQADR